MCSRWEVPCVHGLLRTFALQGTCKSLLTSPLLMCVPLRTSCLLTVLTVHFLPTQVRDGAKRTVRLKEGEPAGRHVVIVDDLVQTGGTLLECHAVLAAHGAKHGECGRGGKGRAREHDAGISPSGQSGSRTYTCARELLHPWHSDCSAPTPHCSRAGCHRGVGSGAQAGAASPCACAWPAPYLTAARARAAPGTHTHLGCLA